MSETNPTPDRPETLSEERELLPCGHYRENLVQVEHREMECPVCGHEFDDDAWRCSVCMDAVASSAVDDQSVRDTLHDAETMPDYPARCTIIQLCRSWLLIGDALLSARAELETARDECARLRDEVASLDAALREEIREQERADRRYDP